MRFLLVEENKKEPDYLGDGNTPLAESLHKLGSNCFITDSPYDIKNLIMNKPKLYRILYDSNIDMYMIGDGNEIIHWDMINEARKLGYYANQEEFIDELGGTLDNYVETGIYGIYEDEIEVDPYLIYIIYSPDEEEFRLGEDGYQARYPLENGVIYTRDSYLEDCDLYKVLKVHSNIINEDVSNQDEEDTDYIELVKKEFESMSSNEIIDLLGIPNSSNIDSDSPMFLLPNGSIISVAQAGKLIGQELSDNIHSDMVYVILSAIAKKYNYDWDMDDGYYEDRKLGYLTYGLEWARMNCGETWAEKRFYCVLPNHMTSAQYRSLEKWLEWGADTGKEEVLVYVGRDEVNQTYGLEETFPEDIIKKIKRYYSSGRLYEDVNNKDLLSFIYENAPLQKEPYWWSTFIVPDGRFIDILSLDEEDFGEHEDFYGWLYDNGYNVYEQDIVDGIGCIKLNVTYPYATCSSNNRPTPQQLRALENWLDEISNTSDFQIQGCEDETRKMSHPVAIGTSDYKIYDLDVTSPRDIIKAIQKSYSSGLLESTQPIILYRGKGNNNNPTNEYSGGRFYASNIDDASEYGDLIQVVELLPNAKLLKYNNSYDYCEDNGLLDNDYDIIPKLTNGRFNTLRDAWEELSWNGENPNLYYQISQYVICQELSNQGYDGAEWLDEDDLVPHQYQIWNDKVIKHIKDVDENGNELKESMEELTKDFSKVDNPKSGDKLTIIDDKDREWNYVAYLWKAPGFTSGMAWKGQKGNPWSNDIAANPKAFNSEFPRGVKKVTINNMNEDINNKLTPSQAAQAVKDLKLNSNPNINVYIDELMQGVRVTFEGTLEGGKKIILWDSNILSTQEQIDTLPDMYQKQSEELNMLREVGYKGIRESNELEQRAKKHKKKSKGMGWHMSMNAGDVEKGIEVFNNSTSLGTSGGEGTAMGEAIGDKTYYYDGPIYYGGHQIASKSNIYTTAKSLNVAIRNILFKATKGDKENLYQYDIVDNMVREISKEEAPKVRPICKTCGYELNDIGDCPVCDYGEYDLLESLSDLEALWKLSNLD